MGFQNRGFTDKKKKNHFAFFLFGDSVPVLAPPAFGQSSIVVAIHVEERGVGGAVFDRAG